MTINATAYKKMLEERAAELVERLRARGEIVVESAPDVMDDMVLSSQRDDALRVLERDSRLLAQIRAALRRIENGSFGICLRCERPVAQKRLDALPWAAFCVRCQESVDELHSRVEAYDERVA